MGKSLVSNFFDSRCVYCRLMSQVNCKLIARSEADPLRRYRLIFIYHMRLKCGGLILIHLLSLSLLFHNHRSPPVPIRDCHLQILLTLPCLSLHFLSPPFIPSLFAPSPPPSSVPSLPTPPIYAYNMPIQLLRTQL